MYAAAVARKPVAALLVLLVLLGAAVAARLLVGGPIEWGSPRSSQILELRTHHVTLGAVVGASLGIAGVMLQSLLRNPLAAPELLGLASGAALAVTIVGYVGAVSGVAAAAAPGQTGAAALAGSMGALALVYALSQRRGFVDPVSLVLVGVIVSVICGAATMFFARLMPDQGFQTARWTIGSLDEDAGWGKVAVVGAAASGAGVIGFALGRAMDAAALSEDEARATGVALGGLRLTLFIASGVLTAGAVVLAGPLGFVGLVCPHVVRLMAGPGHRVLVVGAAMAGATLVIAADAAVKALDFDHGRMPIGIFTALVGGPVFIALLRREAAGR